MRCENENYDYANKNIDNSYNTSIKKRSKNDRLRD